jgi:hypothetical protein
VTSSPQQELSSPGIHLGVFVLGVGSFVDEMSMEIK